MPNRTLPINISTDVLTDTQKVTAGYFTGGGGQLDDENIFTASLSDSNDKYYVNLTNGHPESSSIEPQFSVTFGHVGGPGADIEGGNVVGPTETIYKQWANLLLGPNEITGGFRISGGETSKPTNNFNSVGTRDDYVYILVGKRSRFKDRINPGNWTIALSGSTSQSLGEGGVGSSLITLTDDSKTASATATVVGNRYNIVLGTNGVVSSAASARTLGWFYPEMGAMVFSGVELSASIGGMEAGESLTASFDGGTYKISSTTSKESFSASMGFSPNLNDAGNAMNHLRFANCLQPDGAYMKFRSEEDQNSVSYFCRIVAPEMNFSNNPTFVSGTLNEIRNTDMWGNPTVYITGVNLYSGDGELVATAKLSTPLKKNFGSEATIKVKLTY